MPRFSESSRSKLTSCHHKLQILFRVVIQFYDCTILEGHRSPETQSLYVSQGKSKTLKSNHLYLPSRAVDVAPYPIDWDDHNRFYHFGGFVLGVAATMGLDLRWGGDWDQDHNLNDNGFNDLVHYEINTTEGEI